MRLQAEDTGGKDCSKLHTKDLSRDHTRALIRNCTRDRSRACSRDGVGQERDSRSEWSRHSGKSWGRECRLSSISSRYRHRSSRSPDVRWNGTGRDYYDQRSRYRRDSRSPSEYERRKIKTYILPQVSLHTQNSGNVVLNSVGTRAVEEANKMAKNEEKLKPLSVEGYVELCRDIASSAAKEDDDDPVNVPYISDEKGNEANNSAVVHKKCPPSILFNIKNANNLTLPHYDPKENLRLSFPVASGQDHENLDRDIQMGKAKEEDTVYNDVNSLKEKPDIKKVMQDRLQAQQMLANDSHNIQALLKMRKAEKDLGEWQKGIRHPGLFTGTTGIKVLTPRELDAHTGAGFIRHDYFKQAQRVDEKEGVGKRLMEKMGWKPGQALGRTGQGSIDIIDINFNLDRKFSRSGRPIVRPSRFGEGE